MIEGLGSDRRDKKQAKEKDGKPRWDAVLFVPISMRESRSEIRHIVKHAIVVVELPRTDHQVRQARPTGRNQGFLPGHIALSQASGGS